MAKNFTKEDMLKKHETNVKAAVSNFGLIGILGIIYIVRFFVTKNFNFYFSLSFTELMLRLSDTNKLAPVAAYVLIGLFVAAYAAVFILCMKDQKNLRLAFGLYAFDALCLIGIALVHGSLLKPDFFIDVIMHLFLFVFLFVGIRSEKALRK